MSLALHLRKLRFASGNSFPDPVPGSSPGQWTDCRGLLLREVTILSAWTAARISFYISFSLTPQDDFGFLLNSDGTEYLLGPVAGCTPNDTYLVNQAYFEGLTYISPRSGTRTGTVNQAADAYLILGFERAS